MNEASDTTFTRNLLRDHRKLRWHRLRNRWPFFAWLVIIAIAGYLYSKSTQYGALAGSVQSIHHDISPLQTARVKEICVKTGDPVTNGQIVAEMDTTIIDAEVAQAEATLSAAQGSWATYEAQMHGLVRVFDDEISAAQAAIEQQTGQRDADTAKLAEMKSMQAKRDELFKNKLISEVEADALRPEIARLEKAIPAYGPLIALNQQTLDRRKKDREELQRSLRLAPNEDVMHAIALKTVAQTAIPQAAVETRKRQKGSYSLRSTTDGVVSEIGVFPGTVAQPEVCVVRIVSESRLITGYLPEVRGGSLKVGDHGFAFRLTHPPVKVRVVAVAPEIEAIPASLRPTTAAQQSGVTFRAQRVMFEAEGTSGLTPGESVQLRMRSDWWGKMRGLLGI